jgi:3-oxosteroid 1-dehydrogenase
MAAKSTRWDLEVDVVAAGSGLGAITAAIVARDLGKEVVVLEKAPKLGGLSGYGGGEVYCPNGRHMAEIGVEDSDEATRQYFEFLAAGFNDEALTRTLLATYKTAIEYVEKEAGVRWVPIDGLPDYYYPDAPLANVTKWDYELLGKRITNDQRAMGTGMMGYFLKAALVDRGIAAYVETPIRALLRDDDGAVIGVRAEREGEDFRVRARCGVILAIGGYDHNKDMARMFESMPDWNSSAQPYFQGDHFVVAGEIGAAVASVPATNLGMFFGYNIPGEEHEGVPLYRSSWECGCPHAIWVNRAGKRFCDEAFYKDYQPRLRRWNGHTQTLDNVPPYLIFDQNYRDRYPLGSFAPGMKLPEELVTQADTPRELAAKLGIDGDELEKTLERYNRHARKGEDPDFGSGHYPWSQRLAGDPSYDNPNVGPLDKPPYFGVKLVPVGVGINSHGLRTNVNAQVMHVRGEPIPGLYAVGNSAALLDLGAGYQSGTSNMRAITWGYVAGRHVSGSG